MTVNKNVSYKNKYFWMGALNPTLLSFEYCVAWTVTYPCTTIKKVDSIQGTDQPPYRM